MKKIKENKIKILMKKVETSDLYITQTFSYLYILLERMILNKPLKINKFNWAGGRHTGKTANAMIFGMMAADRMPDKKFAIYLIRKKKQNNAETYSQFIELAPFRLKKNWKMNGTTRVIEGKNLYVRSLGLVENKQPSKKEHLGLKRFKKKSLDYAIIIYDEAFEYDEEDLSSVKFAIGGYKESIEFYCSNPWNIKNIFFQKMIKALPWDESIMKTIGEQFRIYNGEVYQWTNYLKTKQDELMSEEAARELERSSDNFPTLGDIILYGKPGVPANMMFNVHLVQWLTRKQLMAADSKFIDCQVRFGVDFGYTNHPTAVFCGIVNLKRSIVLMYDTLTLPHKNLAYNYKIEMIKIFNFMTKTLNEMEMPQGEFATVYCDSENRTMFDALQKENPDNRLVFRLPRKNVMRFRRSQRVQQWLVGLHKNRIYGFLGRGKDWIDSMSDLRFKFKADGTNSMEEDRAFGENDMYDASSYAFYEEIINNVFSR